MQRIICLDSLMIILEYYYVTVLLAKMVLNGAFLTISMYVYIYVIYIIYILYIYFISFRQIRKEMFFSIVGKSFYSVVRRTFIFYLFMLLFKNLGYISFYLFYSLSQMINTGLKNKTQERQRLEQLLRNVVTLLQICDITTLFYCIQFVTNFVFQDAVK